MTTESVMPLTGVVFETIRPMIVDLGSFIEPEDVALLLALHDDARYHRAQLAEVRRALRTAASQIADGRIIAAKDTLLLAIDALAKLDAGRTA